MSYEEYLALTDGGIVEWVDGEVIFHVPPTLFHRSINFFLSTLVGTFV